MNTQYSCGCGSGCRRGMAREGNRSCPPQSQAAPGPCMTPCAASLPPVAMAYVPMQIWKEPKAPCQGLQAGTIFSDLHKPFCGKGGACR